MNVFQLVLKQMRQRSLSTWLTLLSVVLGVALAIAIMILRREAQAMFGQTDYGYDVLVGPKASPLQLVLNTAYHIDRSPGMVPYRMYETLAGDEYYRRMVRLAVPYAVGDTYKNQRIIGTLPSLFGMAEDGSRMPDERAFKYRPGRRYELAEGRVFHPRKFEAVIGSDIPEITGLKLGEKFKAVHGGSREGQTPDEHDTEWTVVGVLEPTQTANDRVLFIPLISFYAIGEHEDALESISKYRPQSVESEGPESKEPSSHEDSHSAPGHDPGLNEAPSAPPKALEDFLTGAAPATSPAHDDHDHDHDGKQDHAPEEHDDHAGHDHGHEPFSINPDGTIHLDLPRDKWMVSAILVQSRSPFAASSLMYAINNGVEAMAVNPASVMREFFSSFLEPGTRLWLLVAILVTLVASVSILVSIYNAIVARLREIAILRALGATRRRILLQICLEAGLIGLAGAVLGLILGHLLAAAGSAYLRRLMGEGLNWTKIGGEEALYLLAVTVIAVLAGLVPAMKAYRTPVATNLTTG
ncbi:MAG TPA: ABC transporter permease [Tepidisphaeraceae bacterium]|nr:ABC transporter permease [Tepidisphaeraceae bacterium]